MQGPEQTMDVDKTVRKKPSLTVWVAVASAVVLLAALFAAHSIFMKSYSGHLDRLKGLVAEEASKFERGDPQADAAGQYRYYLSIDAQLANLSDILAKLNDGIWAAAGARVFETHGTHGAESQRVGVA